MRSTSRLARAERGAGSTPSRKGWLNATAFYAIATGVMTYPLIRGAATTVTRPSADPLLNTWILWWTNHHWPLTDAWWSAPMFYPSRGVMAFSELLLGLSPITAPVQWWSDNSLLAHNVALLVSFPLCALPAHPL